MQYYLTGPALTPGTYLSNQNLLFMKYYLTGPAQCFPG
jgi:hypothetical protein